MTANHQLARRLEEIADLLAEPGLNRFRVQAYRRAVEMRRLPAPVCDILEREGLEGLRRLQGIGDLQAIAIRHLVQTGQLTILRRLRGETDAVELLQSAPGIGRMNANQLHHDLGIDSLEDLAAACDGRLAQIPGFGRKRVAGVMDSRSSRLAGVRIAERRGEDLPSVAELLDVDREYREQVAWGQLHKIALRRFGPGGKSLPADPAHTERVIGITRRCSRTRRERISSEGRGIG
jgi:putative hydrolase